MYYLLLLTLQWPPCPDLPIQTNQNPHPARSANPYQPVGDFLSNISRFKIIESTLREGEQFANAYFDTETKIKM